MFARTVFTGRRDTKLLARFHGPFRITELKGNTAVLKSFVTGRMSAVSLRNIKLICPGSLSMTNQNQIFPDYLSKDADFSEEDVSQSPHITRVKSQDDLSSLDMDRTAVDPASVSTSVPQGAPALNGDSLTASSSQPGAETAVQPGTTDSANIRDELYDSLPDIGQGAVGENTRGSPSAQSGMRPQTLFWMN